MLISTAWLASSTKSRQLETQATYFILFVSRLSVSGLTQEAAPKQRKDKKCLNFFNFQFFAFFYFSIIAFPQLQIVSSKLKTDPLLGLKKVQL